MTQPLKDYLTASGETLTGFAKRIGVSRRTLSRILSGESRPRPEIARRIAEATGGAAVFGDFYGEAGAVADLGAARAEEAPLDAILLEPVLRFVLAGAAESGGRLSDAIAGAAAEAAVNAHDAMARITTRKGPDRLRQVLLPVFREIRKDCPELALAEDRLDEAARLAAVLYFRAKPA